MSDPLTPEAVHEALLNAGKAATVHPLCVKAFRDMETLAADWERQRARIAELEAACREVREALNREYGDDRALELMVVLDKAMGGES